MGASWYDPGNGRFLTRDDYRPGLSSGSDTNRYLHGAANPLTNLTPTATTRSVRMGTGALPGITSFWQVITCHGIIPALVSCKRLARATWATPALLEGLISWTTLPD
jgi:hypothetical protein